MYEYVTKDEWDGVQCCPLCGSLDIVPMDEDVYGERVVYECQRCGLRCNAEEMEGLKEE